MNEIWLAVVALVGTLGTATITVLGTYFKLKYDAELIALHARIESLERGRTQDQETIKKMEEERAVDKARIFELERITRFY